MSKKNNSMLELAEIYQVGSRAFYLCSNSEKNDTVNEECLHNPYHFEGNVLYDVNEQVDDYALARLLRNELVIKTKSLDNFTGKYMFFREDGNIGYRKNKKSWLDIINILTGNMYTSKKDMTEKEKQRVRSTYEILSSGTMGSILKDAWISRSDVNIIDDDDVKLKGILADIFKHKISEH